MPTPDQDILFAAASVGIQAAADGKKPARVSILAYSGQPFVLDGQQFVLDLGGADVSGSIPLLADHENSLRSLVGSGEAVVRGNQLLVSGILSDATEVGRQVLALAKSGVSLQASVGYAPGKRERLQPGESTTVNGQVLKAAGNSITVVRSGKLRECSLVPIGADPGTQVHIAAKGGATVTDNDDAVQKLRDREAAELERCEGIKTAFRRFDQVETVQWEGKTLKAASFRQKAIREGLDLRDVELALMKADIPKGPAIRVRPDPGDTSMDVLECRLAMHVRGLAPQVEKVYGQETCTRANDLKCWHVLDVLRLAADSMGLNYRNPDSLIRLAASTSQISNLLSNVAGKSLTSGFQAFKSVARVIARKVPGGSDFKQKTLVRLGGNTLPAQMGPSGSFEHAALTDSATTYQLDTFGKMVVLSRQQLRNDDLGALDDVPRLIGRGFAQRLEGNFWTLVLNGIGSFWAAGNGNYIDGANSALGLTGLGLGVAAMMKFLDADSQEPLNVTPKFLVVPPDLLTTAQSLFVSENISLTGSTDASSPSGNPYKGAYTPLVSPYVVSTFHASATAVQWWLFSDPADVAAYGLAYLDDKEDPTIETVDMPADFLGMGWRAYHDFDCFELEAKGGLMSKGSA